MEKKIYEKGDIIFIKNLRFKDGEIDIRIKGHPYLLLEDVLYEGQEVKVLKITTKNKFPQIKLNKGILKRVSFIDLSQEYKVHVYGFSFPYAHINLEEYLRNYTSIIF